MAEGKERKGPNFTTATYISSALKKIDSLKTMSAKELIEVRRNLKRLNDEFKQVSKERRGELKSELQKEMDELDEI